MKKSILAMAAIMLCAFGFAQNTQWKEFNDFHHLVGKVLHPVMLGKVQQLKDSSANLLASAKKWQTSAIPANVDAAEFKTRISNLVSICSALDAAVQQNQSDSVLKTLSVKVHDTFHALLSACKLKE